METTNSYHSSVNWDLLLRQLTATAAAWFLEEDCMNEEAVLPATGKSAKELAFDAVFEFTDGKISWHPKSLKTAHGELYWLLRKVMRHDFLDLIKKGRAYQRTSVLDAHQSGERDQNQTKSQPALEDFPDGESKIDYAIDAAILSRRLLPLVVGEKDLEDCINAVLEGGCTKREDIAAYLDITPQEVTNRMRKLIVRLAAWKRKLNSERWG